MVTRPTALGPTLMSKKIRGRVAEPSEAMMRIARTDLRLSGFWSKKGRNLGRSGCKLKPNAGSWWDELGWNQGPRGGFRELMCHNMACDERRAG